MARQSPSPAEVLGIRIDQLGETTVCSLRGELDAINAPRLRGVLAERLESDVVVDLAQLEFIDSSGLGVLVGALKRFEAAGQRLRLRAPSSAIRRVFSITGLDQAFIIED